jgi:hypothetical protein
VIYKMQPFVVSSIPERLYVPGSSTCLSDFRTTSETSPPITLRSYEKTMRHHRHLKSTVLSVVLLQHLHLCTAVVPRGPQSTELQGGRRVDCDAPFSADLLGLSSGSEVFLESDADFAQRSIRWTDYMRPDYAIVVQPATVGDVQKLVSGVHYPRRSIPGRMPACHVFECSRLLQVRYAGRCQIPFLGTSAQHGFDTTLAQIQNGLAIDLSKFRSVNVNARQSTMTVGGGVRFRDVYDPLFAAGKEASKLAKKNMVPSYSMEKSGHLLTVFSDTGASACVGLVSPSLGGGVGRLQGVRGMMVDSLRSAQLVTADGSLVTVSARSNPGLFWALRGAGANFGIVVEATYEVYDLTSPMVASTDIIFSPADAGPIIDFLEAFGDHAPEKLGIILTAAFQNGSVSERLAAARHVDAASCLANHINKSTVQSCHERRVPRPTHGLARYS